MRGFARVKLVSFPSDISKAVPLLQFFITFVKWWFQKHFIIRSVFYISKGNLFDVYSYEAFVLSFLFLISFSFGVSGKLCFVILAFPRYLHIFLDRFFANL